MVAQTRLRLRAAHGIEDDVNANAISPRQVLVIPQEDLAAFSIPPGALRENIVIGGADAERVVPGSVLGFESGASIRLTFYCEPCKHVAPFVTLIKRLERKRGILGVVLTNGTITVGERVRLQPNAFPALSDIPYERFLQFVQRVPAGRVVSYRQILVGIGVSKSYFRVMPHYLRKAATTDCPIHRVVDSQGYLISHIANHQELLAAEDVHVTEHCEQAKGGSVGWRCSISLDRYGWNEPTVWE